MFDLLEALGRWYSFNADGDANPSIAITMFCIAFSVFMLYLSSLINRNDNNPYTSPQIIFKFLFWLIAFASAPFFTIFALMYTMAVMSNGPPYNYLCIFADSRAKFILNLYSCGKLSKVDAVKEIRRIFKEAKHVI